MQKARSPFSFRVRVNTIRVEHNADGKVEFDAQRVIVHVNWDPTHYLCAYNMVLIQLYDAVDFGAVNDYIALTCLLPARISLEPQRGK